LAAKEAKVKLPNLASLATIFLAIVPVLIATLTDSYPPATYWWSGLAITILGWAAKYLQERSSTIYESSSTRSRIYRSILR
jgi:hypothetical protein